MLATLKSKTPIGPESPSPFLQLQEELTGICTLCENLLVLQRTFILCSVYLNMPLRVQTDRTREKTGTVVSDLLLLVEASLSGTLQRLQTFSVLCLKTTNLPGDFSEGLDVGIRKYLDGF
ncbi:hypothetical protein BaRGS_00039128 [Batillaria attramentaria]|uniref:Uncharacterized protein n=1 Tax=Batillaria attramentaria TaxID=370345 RepID=A0ABD0J3Z0_9CAEN